METLREQTPRLQVKYSPIPGKGIRPVVVQTWEDVVKGKGKLEEKKKEDERPLSSRRFEERKKTRKGSASKVFEELKKSLIKEEVKKMPEEKKKLEEKKVPEEKQVTEVKKEAKIEETKGVNQPQADPNNPQSIVCSTRFF